MNCKKLLILLTAGLVGIVVLAACSSPDAPAETGSGTKGETEAVTAIPRYDYMDAEVAPDVTIEKADYTDLTLTISDSFKITEQTIADSILSIRFENRMAENGTTQVKDKPVKLGDDAFIYYKGFLGDEAFDGGSNWDNETPHQLGIGSGKFIPGFEEALIDLVPNATSKENPAEIKVTFPEEYDEKLAGKEATFKIVIMYTVQYQLPEYNRDFVVNKLKYEPKKEFYASDRALLDEFEEYVREDLQKNMATSLQNAKIEALWNHLTEKVTCKNLPEIEMTFYVGAYMDELEYYFDYYTAAGGEEFKKHYPDLPTFAVDYMGLEKGADWEDELRKLAERMVQKDMITHAIGELEGIESVTDEEYNAQIEYWINYNYGAMTAAEVVQSMGEVFLIESAFAEKMQTWLLDRVTFTFSDGTPVDAEQTPAEGEETADGTSGETDAATEGATDGATDPAA